MHFCAVGYLTNRGVVRPCERVVLVVDFALGLVVDDKDRLRREYDGDPDDRDLNDRDRLDGLFLVTDCNWIHRLWLL